MNFSEEWLYEAGFNKLDTLGVPLQFSLVLPEPYKTSIIISYGDPYQHEEGYMVWLCCDDMHISMKYIRDTIALNDLYRCLCGKGIMDNHYLNTGVRRVAKYVAIGNTAISQPL